MQTLFLSTLFADWWRRLLIGDGGGAGTRVGWGASVVIMCRLEKRFVCRVRRVAADAARVGGETRRVQ